LIDVKYLEATSRRKRRMDGRLPPPPPNKGSIFPMHTPPSTPHRFSRTSVVASPLRDDVADTKESILPLFEQTSVEDLTFLNGLTTFEDRDPQFSNNSDFPHLLESSSSTHGVVFVDQKKPEDSVPDLSNIKRTCNRYYPHIIKHHAPSSARIDRCAKYGCDSEPNGPWYHCTSCFASGWFCRECIVSVHTNNPFHRLEEWCQEEMMCKSVALEKLGLVVRLSGLDGVVCQCVDMEGTIKTLEVIHTNGTHKMNYHTCHIEDNRNSTQTALPELLISNGLYPATDVSPKRAFTFELLTEYNHLNLSGFINIKQFLDAKLSFTKDNMPDQVGNKLIKIL
jgi:hypothetical protein